MPIQRDILHALAALAVVGAGLASSGCPVSTRNLCESDGMEHVGSGVPRDCHRCGDDGDCVFTGNVCEGTVFCAHRDADLVSTSIGCSPEPTPPADEDCVCRDSYCQVL